MSLYFYIEQAKSLSSQEREQQVSEYQSLLQKRRQSNDRRFEAQLNLGFLYLEQGDRKQCQIYWKQATS